ncbi:MAG: PAS domain S-box protein [Saprospiraceae bacterium]|nr:PAS domain S-box protein [Saprospiraceae bacterium]
MLLYFLLKVALNKLSSAEKQYKLLFFENPSPLYIYDDETFQIVEVNNALLSTHGYSREEFLGMSLLDFRPEKEVQRLKSHLLSRNSNFSDSGLWLHKFKDGTERYVKVYSSPTTFDNRPCRMVHAVIVHDQILAEERSKALSLRLEENDSYLRSLIDSQTNYLIRLDTRGHVTYINKSFSEMLQLSSGILSGNLLFGQIFRQESASHFIHKLSAELQKAGNSEQRTLNVKWPGAMPSTTQWEFVGIFDQNGSLIEIQGIGRDVTDKLELVQLLENEREKLDTILSSIDNIVWSIDIDSLKVLFVNDAFYRILGYQPEDHVFEGEFYHRIIPSDWFAANSEDFLSFLLHHKKMELEIPVYTANGEIAVFYSQLNYVPASDMHPAIVNGISIDLSELRKSEARAKKYSDQIEQIMKSITDGFFTFDLDWNLTFVNDAFAQFTSFEKAELIGKNIYDVMSELKGSVFETQFIKALEEKSPAYFKGYYEAFNSWIQVAAYPSEEGLSVWSRDITEQVDMQEKINKTQNNLNAVVDSTPNFIWSIDKDFKLVIANKACVEFADKFGVKIVPGQRVKAEPLIDSFLVKLENYYNRALVGEYFNVIERLTLPGEDPVYNSVFFNPVRSQDGQVEGVACFSINITNIITAEQQILNQNEKLRTIAWLQSHKVRGPLSNIMGLSNLMQIEWQSKPEMQHMLQLMSQATKDLDSIIHEITEKTEITSPASGDK